MIDRTEIPVRDDGPKEFRVFEIGQDEPQESFDLLEEAMTHIRITRKPERFRIENSAGVVVWPAR